jgi:peptide/nickel transport system substrate-binding protein
MAVDRTAFADTVFFGAGVPVYGPETEANKKWYWREVPKTPHDPEGAKRLLSAIGLVQTTDDGLLHDAGNRPARFTLLTQKGRPALERGSAVIRDELKKIGLTVDVVALEGNALIQRIVAAKYDAIYFNADMTDTDPAVTPDFWFSFGEAHFWNMAQKTPATEWERRIDELMMRQIASSDELERKRLFDEVQKVFSEHLPVVYFVAPRVYVAASARVMNLMPAISKPQLLWTADTLAVAH